MDKKSNSRFEKRFKGRKVLMTKDGITGIIARKGEPVDKSIPIYKQISMQNKVTYPTKSNLQIQLPNSRNIKYPRQRQNKKKAATGITKNFSRPKGNQKNMDMFIQRMQNNNQMTEVGSQIVKNNSLSNLYLIKTNNKVKYNNPKTRQSMKYQKPNSNPNPLRNQDQQRSLQIRRKQFTPMYIMPQNNFGYHQDFESKSVKSVKGKNNYQFFEGQNKASLSYQGNFHPQDNNIYNQPYQPVELNNYRRQYYSTYSDQRNLKKQERARKNQYQLNNFIKYAISNHQEENEKTKNKRNNNLRRGAYNVLNSRNELSQQKSKNNYQQILRY